VLYKNRRRLLLAAFLLPASLPAQKDSLARDTALQREAKVYFTKYGLSPDSAVTPTLYYGVYDWLGTRYHYSGCTKKGIDCSGFVSEMYRTAYGIALAGGSRDLYTLVDTVSKTALKEGDILFFKIRKGQISHVAVYLGHNKFAHATVHGGVMVSDLDEAYYRKYYFTGGHLKKSSPVKP
jgi:lipoprotein Spr